MQNAQRETGQRAWSRSSSSIQGSSLNKHHLLKDFRHRNINEAHEESLTLGQRIADRVANFVGSWKFIISQTTVLCIWIFLNVLPFIYHFDPYPYIAMNLLLSAQAAYATPLVLMSQNRQAEKDRLKAEQDYLINIKAEHEVMETLDRIERQEKLILKLIEKIEQQEQREIKMLEKINVLITRTGRYYQ